MLGLRQAARDVITVLVTASVAVVVAGASWLCLYRVQIPQPALGVFDASDTLLLAAAVVAYPFLLMTQPSWVSLAVTFLLIAVATSDLCRGTHLGTASRVMVLSSLITISSFIAANPQPSWSTVARDAVLIAVVTGVVVSWAQAGMKMQHLGVLLAILTIYDCASTLALNHMQQQFAALQAQQFPLLLVVPLPGGDQVTFGLGDALVVGLAPTVVRISLGDGPGRIAFLVTVGAVTAIGALAATQPGRVLPVMATLGPVLGLTLAILWQTSRRLSDDGVRNNQGAAPTVGQVLSAHS